MGDEAAAAAPGWGSKTAAALGEESGPVGRPLGNFQLMASLVFKNQKLHSPPVTVLVLNLDKLE